jgi:hypothetical protein
MWLPEGLRRSEVNSTTARHHAAGIPDLIQTDLLPQSRLDREIPEEVIVHHMCMKLRGVALVALIRCAGVIILVP